jgi:hypothetical protein
MTNHHDLPGIFMLSCSYVLNVIEPNGVLVWVQIFAGLAAGAYYLKRFLKKGV